MTKKIDYSIYLVTDDYYLDMDGVFRAIEMALQNGVTLMQYRAKEYSSRKMLQDARILRELCWKYDVPLIVNDRLDIALAVDADGLHLGQDDLPLDVARRYIGNKIIGVSATCYEEAKDAILQGADYVGVGPVFPTLTKKDAKPVCGLEGIRKLKREFPGAPLIAIGGIDLTNIKQVIEAGVDGVAIISAILGSEDKSAAVRQFAQIFAGDSRMETES